jgi:hypothetical protein
MTYGLRGKTGEGAPRRERDREKRQGRGRGTERRFGAFVCFLFFEWKKGS